MSAGQIAALIAAGAFVVLVLLLAVPLLKLGRTLDEATIAIRKAHEGSAPLLDNAQTTLQPGEHPAGAGRRHHLQRPDGQSQRLRAGLAVHRHPGRSAGAGRRVLLRPEQGDQGPARANRNAGEHAVRGPARSAAQGRGDEAAVLARRRRGRGVYGTRRATAAAQQPHPGRYRRQPRRRAARARAPGSARSGPRCGPAWSPASEELDELVERRTGGHVPTLARGAGRRHARRRGAPRARRAGA